MRKEALIEFAKAGNLDVVPQLRENTSFQELTKKRAEVYSNYLDALNQYGPNFPKLQRQQAQLKELDSMMDGEGKTILAALRNDYNTARQRERFLSEALNNKMVEGSYIP